ncbi:phage major capsid family protein [Williamsia muralis]|uniref:Phage major capsid protein n=1 Tax=Williamsia marianensis TaxID=85044 RepID=A0ABU4EXA0_WILMA|nr:phage major capsid protein [Williamsia muralis]MDV7135381.1 phage major capsid protein [Williamsia muralis]
MRTKSVDLGRLKAATDDADNGGGDLKERRARLIAEAQAVIAEIEALDGELTTEEKSAIEAASKSTDQLDEWIDRATKSAALRANFGGGGGVGRLGGTLNVKSARVAEGVASKMGLQGPDGVKALSAPGTAITSIPLDGQVLPLGQASTSVLDVLPSVVRSVIYAYLRQVTRENHAAIVAPGDVKPTSIYTTEREEQRLKVAAHLSEAVDKYDLEDASMLSQFLESELRYGLAVEIERLVVNGVLATDGMTGILQTSGVQVQPFATDIITSVRKAITKLETVGHVANTLLINPIDYETLELSRRPGDGQFELGPNLPVERGAERVWGLSRATSVAVPVGTGVVLDRNAVAVATDGRVEVKWGDQVGESFERNELIARCETRVNVDVFKPRAVVKVALAAI